MTEFLDLPTDAQSLRRTFALFPSGVAAVAAEQDGVPEVLVASSFQVGISADPPLVLFAVQHGSRTWPRLRRAPTLGVSVLGEGHDALCRQLAAKEGDRFAGVDVAVTAHGSILLHGAPVWLECHVEREVPAGDHDVVLLRVLGARTDPATPPLIFHASRFRGLAAC